MRKLAWVELQKNMMNDDTMIDKRTCEVLSPEVDSTYWKDHKITCCMVEELHILNGIDTLGI